MSYWALNRDNLWSSLDELALLVGLSRDPDEPDATFIRRITDRLRYPPSSTKQGLVNALSIEFGLVPHTIDDKTIFALTQTPVTVRPNGTLSPITVTVDGSGQLQYVEHASSDTPPGWVVPTDATAYTTTIDTRVGDDDPPSGFILWKDADGRYTPLLEFIGPPPPTNSQVRVEYEIEDQEHRLHPWADFSHPENPEDRRFRGQRADSPDVGTQVRILDPEELATNPGSVSRREVAAMWRRLYGTTWDTFRWDQYSWGDAELEGSGRIDNILDAVTPTGYADYVGGTGPDQDLKCIGVEITPSSWMPQIVPGTFYVGHRPFYLHEQRQDAPIAGGQAYLELSGVAWGHPVSVTDPAQYPASSGSYQQGDGGLASTTDAVWLDEGGPTGNQGADRNLRVGVSGTLENASLIRFPSLIGYGPGQIPPKSRIQTATLFLTTTDITNDIGNVFVHRMLQPWTEGGATYNTTNGSTVWSIGGAQNPDTDYNAEPDDPASQTPTASGITFAFNVASGVQIWSDGMRNDGWVVRASGSTEAADLASDDAVLLANRPLLETTWTDPTLLDSQWSPRYAYDTDRDRESSTPWSHRHIPNLSMLSGVADGLAWAPSGGQFWTSTPDWADLPASGQAQVAVLGLQLGDGAPSNLTASYELADPSGIASLTELDVNPTTSWMYRNKLLVVSDGPMISGSIVAYGGSPLAVAPSGFVHIVGALMDLTGAPVPGQDIMLQWINATGDVVDAEGTVQSSVIQKTRADGTFHFRFVSESPYTTTPMTFWAEAREFDLLSLPINVEKAVLL